MIPEGYRRSRWFMQARILYGPARLRLYAVLLVVGFAVSILLEPGAGVARQADVVAHLERLLPLVAAMLAVDLISRDAESGTFELLVSYPGGYCRTLLERTITAGSVFIVATTIIWAASGLVFGVWPGLAELLRWTLPPAAFLGALALFAGGLSASTLAGIIVAVLVWAVNLLFGDALPQGLYLFAYTSWEHLEPLAANRVSLLSWSVVLLGAILWLIEYRRRVA